MNLLYLPIILPFVTAVACLEFTRWSKATPVIGTIGAVAQLIGAIYLLDEVLVKELIVGHTGGWAAPVGISFVADKLAVAMVVITAIISVVINLYGWAQLDSALIKKHYFALVHFLLMGVNGAFLTGDLFNLYVWFEVMLIASFVLMTIGGTKAQLEGGVKYLVINLVASVLFLCSVGLIYGKVGTLNMADISYHLRDSVDAHLVNSSGILLLIAFGIKAGLFPFFFWLPASYHTLTPTTLALFAGLLTKVGVYALLRTYTLIFESQFELIQPILIWIAGLTMAVGVMGAASHYNIKKILSFHIISQIGYIMMGIAIATPLAIAGAVFYTLHHIIVKTNLFLIDGMIAKHYGTSDLKKLGGLYKWSPIFALLFFIPAFSLGGIPPLSGFWAKLSLIQAGVEANHYFLVATAGVVGIFTLFSMTKIWAEAFWKKPDPETPKFKLPSLREMTPALILASLTLLIGLNGDALFEFSKSTSNQLLSPEAYVKAVLNK